MAKYLFEKKINPWEVVKVGNNEICFTTTHIGRLFIYIFGEPFGLQIWYTCYLLRDDLVKNICHKIQDF
jgi:hypothetical protein